VAISVFVVKTRSRGAIKKEKPLQRLTARIAGNFASARRAMYITVSRILRSRGINGNLIPSTVEINANVEEELTLARTCDGRDEIAR